MAIQPFNAAPGRMRVNAKSMYKSRDEGLKDHMIYCLIKKWVKFCNDIPTMISCALNIIFSVGFAGLVSHCNLWRFHFLNYPIKVMCTDLTDSLKNWSWGFQKQGPKWDYEEYTEFLEVLVLRSKLIPRCWAISFITTQVADFIRERWWIVYIPTLANLSKWAVK